MKKLKFVSSSALALMVLGSAAPTLAATYADSKHATSKATIAFEEDKETGPIVNPDDPDKPVEPVNPVNPTGAELMISYASDLNFGTQSKQEQSWNALGDQMKDITSGKTIDVAPVVSVKDSRGLDRKGWSLTVKQDGDFKDSTGKVLTGAEISYSNLKTLTGVGAPAIKTGEIKVGQTATELASATATTGVGGWTIGLGTYNATTKTTNGVTLKVPSTSPKNTGSYSTTLTYELIADPAK